MFEKIYLYFQTIRHLKWIQIKFQIWYKIRYRFRFISGFKYNININLPIFKNIKFDESLNQHTSYYGDYRFKFLNITHAFKDIDWDYLGYGKLWTYNLNYFDFLNQSDAKLYTEEYCKIILNFISDIPKLKNANEPFPTSLRVINWIKYFVTNNIINHEWQRSLYAQIYRLNDYKEYHILGNHILENGFALLFGGVYFQDKFIFDQGQKLIENELNEQILSDGAHFELSPMYHSIMLYRVLDTINLLSSNQEILRYQFKGFEEFLKFLKEKATKMCTWLKAISYENGEIPHFNDSTNKIAPSTQQLLSYAHQFSINIDDTILGESGYRRLKNKNLDLILKGGKIGPEYIAGHAHADNLTFEVRISGLPFLVDKGISTYENNKTRLVERSTLSHNTVEVEGKNTAQVWASFRVGRRYSSYIIDESKTNILAYYKTPDYKHIRDWTLTQNELIIFDQIGNKNGIANFHFHPNINVSQESDHILCGEAKLYVDGAQDIIISNYEYSMGFNSLISAQKISISFFDSLTTKFYF